MKTITYATAAGNLESINEAYTINIADPVLNLVERSFEGGRSTYRDVVEDASQYCVSIDLIALKEDRLAADYDTWGRLFRLIDRVTTKVYDPVSGKTDDAPRAYIYCNRSWLATVRTVARHFYGNGVQVVQVR